MGLPLFFHQTLPIVWKKESLCGKPTSDFDTALPKLWQGYWGRVDHVSQPYVVFAGPPASSALKIEGGLPQPPWPGLGPGPSFAAT
jgi:hypothetical protein